MIVVSGPPCSGKSTYIEEHRSPSSVVVDLDALAVALGHPGDRIDWQAQHPARVAALRARASVLKAAREGKLGREVWVVDSRADDPDVLLDPGADECHRRAKADGRPGSTFAEIERWYADR